MRAVSLVAVLDGAYEMPPDASHATRTTEVVAEGRTLRYRVHADSISDVTDVELHIGDVREQESAVASLFQGDRAGMVSGLVVSSELGAHDLAATTMRALLGDLRRGRLHHDRYAVSSDGRSAGQLRVQPAGTGR